MAMAQQQRTRTQEEEEAAEEEEEEEEDEDEGDEEEDVVGGSVRRSTRKRTLRVANLADVDTEDDDDDDDDDDDSSRTEQSDSASEDGSSGPEEAAPRKGSRRGVRNAKKPRLANPTGGARGGKDGAESSEEEWNGEEQEEEDGSEWELYDTETDNETLEHIASFPGMPAVSTLLGLNARHLPGLTRTSRLRTGTRVYIRRAVGPGAARRSTRKRKARLLTVSWAPLLPNSTEPPSHIMCLL
jgi:hypothetical protein